MSEQIEFSLVDETRHFESPIRCPDCGYFGQTVRRWDFEQGTSYYLIRCTNTGCAARTPEFADLKTAAQVWKVAEALTR